MDSRLPDHPIAEPVTRHDNILPEAKQTGFVKGHFFRRLTVDPNTADGKAGSVAFMTLSQKRNPKARLNNAIINLGIKHGKLIKSETKTRMADGTVKTETIAVNVNSLANKLGVGKGSIDFFASNKGQVSELMTSVYKTTSSQQKTVHAFFTESPEGKAQAKQIGALFIHTLDPAKQKHSAEFNIGNKTFITYGNRIAQTREENQLFDDEARKRQKLGEGSFGIAYRLESFCPKNIKLDSDTLVEKVSKKSDNPKMTARTKREIVCEHQNLQFIADELNKPGAPDNVREGLQKPSYGVNVGQNRGAIIVDRYDGDLIDFIPEITVAGRIKLIDNQIRALSFTQSIGLVHIDIKPDNIFVDLTDRNNPVFRLADWGGARDVNYLVTPDGKKEPLAFTRAYVPFDENYLTRNREESPDGMVEALQRLSTFELGCTLYITLTYNPSTGEEQFPYEKREEGYQDTRRPFNSGALAGYPPALVDFIRLLCHPNPAERPTGAVLAEKWNTIVENLGGLENLMKSAQTQSATASQSAPAASPQPLPSLMGPLPVRPQDMPTIAPSPDGISLSPSELEGIPPPPSDVVLPPGPNQTRRETEFEEF